MKHLYRKHLKPRILTEWKLHLIDNQNFLERTALKYVIAIQQESPEDNIIDKFELFLVAYGYMTQQEAMVGDNRGAPKLYG